MKLYISRLSHTEEYLLECLRDYLNLDSASNIKVMRHLNNKPYIEGYGIEISISHSGDYITALIGNGQLGIDIEKIKSRDYLKLAGRYFNPWEAERVQRLGIQEFYRLWTMKEAFCKLKGYNLNARVSEEEIKSLGYSVKHIVYHEKYIITIIGETDEILTLGE